MLSLLEYQKVLLLDLDIVVIHCLDELFDLNPPAAMHRTVAGAWHGTCIDGRCFFVCEDIEPGSNQYEWGQSSAINAGVILLRPVGNLHASALSTSSFGVWSL